MRFLNRLLKTPDEEQDETKDEFDAEEKGLLMIPSLPGDKEEAPPPATMETVAGETGTLAAQAAAPGPPAEAEAAAGPDEVAQPPASEGEPPTATEESQPVEGSAPETEGEEAEEGEGSPDDPMHMFRASAKRTHMAAALKDDLGDVSIADLLADAQAVRNLLGGPSASDAGQGKQQAA
jgi:hypothetical protein